MRTLLSILCIVFICTANAQTEDDYLPQVSMLAMDSTETVAKRFAHTIVKEAVPGYAFAFEDREDIMLSKYIFDNGSYESLKFEFQFSVEEVTEDSLTVQKRIVILQRITGELPVITSIYNYLFGTTHTPDKIMAISVYDKAIAYRGGVYNSSVVADDFKPGYWILSFFRM